MNIFISVSVDEIRTLVATKLSMEEPLVAVWGDRRFSCGQEKASISLKEFSPRSCRIFKVVFVE